VKRILNSTTTKFSVLLIAALFSLTALCSAQSGAKNAGKIAGKVVNSKTGEPIIGANVSITGSGQGAATDIDGSYMIKDVNPGIYSVTISYISYAKKTVTDVEVDPNKTTRLAVSLEPKTVGMEEVTVTARASRSSEAGLLAIQRKSVPMQDGMSSEQISKIGDSDVGAAMRRVTGVTVRNGKDVYVRGLGNRYSNIQLNGSQVPSTDPNKKEAPTDLFSSGLVESIMVQKTYTADQLAEFSGGSVKIETKQFPYERNFTMSYSTSFNTVSTFENTLSSPGSPTDFLGYDSGKRSLPSVLNAQRGSQQNSGQVVQGLHNDWDISRNKVGIPSQSISVNYANQFNEDNMPIGVVSNFSYKFDREFEPNKTERFMQFFKQNGEPNYITNYTKDEGTETAETSAMLNVFAKPSSVTKFGVKTLYSNSARYNKTIVQGPYQNGVTRQTVLDFDRRSIFSTTLEGETYFDNFFASNLEGHISYNQAQRIRPDRRSTRYNLVGDEYQFQPFGDNNGHFFSDQDDKNYSAELKYKMKPFKFLNISAGGNVIVKDRHFTARRITYRDQLAPYLPSDLKTQPAGVVLDDQNVAGQGNNGYLELTETTQFNSDWYDGFQTIYAGFMSTNWKPLEKLTLELGLRVEQSTQTIEVPTEGIDSDYEEVSQVDSTDLLPAVNVTYQLADRTNIRLAYSQTLARPEFREISNFNFADYLGGQRVYGNPDLKQTNITNYDIRFETYPSGGQMLALSAFYKHFKNPIEKFYRLTDANEVFFDNAPEADLYGVEIEGRKNITPRLQMVANASYIYSQSRMNESASSRVANVERPMVGQSPYIINVSAFYQIPTLDIDVSLSYNTFGERIVTVGKNAQQYDEYEQPFHDLGATIDYQVGKFDLSLEVSNLLNDSHLYKQGPATTFRYKPGMSFSLGASMDL